LLSPLRFGFEFSLKRCRGPVEQHGECRLGEPHCGGGVTLVEVRQMAQRECSLVSRIDLVECGTKTLRPVIVVDMIKVVDKDPIVHAVNGPLRPVSTPASGSAVVIGELIRRDPEEPWGDPAPSPGEPVDAGKSLLERDCGEIFGQLPRPTTAVNEGVHPIDIEPVEVCEGIRVMARLLGELPLCGRIRG
jgi:hypothetical protein